ncbi:unnamed protein product [Parnassius mnemosyne]|uniref:Reverse transcriptase domain-containing protein n=1 Tax=Parnassius mnemosyne TaxID=213953 RepID=A0AAV1LIH3_9NEOP
MTDGNKKSSSPGEICDLFASYVGAVYNAQHDINSELNVNKWNLICNYSLELTAPYLNMDQILNIMKSVDDNKGSGPDGVPSLFMKACADELVTPIYLIFKKSLQSGLFPDVWKSAKVVPIHKADNVEVVGNNRPISIPSTLCKIFESLVYPVLQKHMNHYLTEWQHGFVRFRSTCTNLTLFTETLVEAVDDGRDVDVIYTDLSKAFDKVPHNILISKMRAYGITGSLLGWKSVLGANSLIPSLCKLVNGHSNLVDIHADSFAKIKKVLASAWSETNK